MAELLKVFRFAYVFWVFFHVVNKDVKIRVRLLYLATTKKFRFERVGMI